MFVQIVLCSIMLNNIIRAAFSSDSGNPSQGQLTIKELGSKTAPHPPEPSESLSLVRGKTVIGMLNKENT